MAPVPAWLQQLYDAADRAPAGSPERARLLREAARVAGAIRAARQAAEDARAARQAARRRAWKAGS